MDLRIDQYNKFSSSRVAKHSNKRIGDYQGFNLASGTKTFNHGINNYNLFSNRFYYSLVDHPDNVISGNSFSKCSNVEDHYYGSHFIWNNWSNLSNLRIH